MWKKTTYPSPLGDLTLASHGDALAGLWLAGQKHFGGKLPITTIETGETPALQAACAWLTRYFVGEQPAAAELTLAPVGTPFQQRVWEVLRAIPHGEVTTYGDIALRLNCVSARAVGGAVGRNPISIIIPCHRVVGASGGLTGFAGGLDAKRQLLTIEGRV